MANTLKFGNGQFATKEGSTLAYNSENGNFKPLPFTFDRSTSATRVNKQGLIEVVSNNEPRIDFLNDSNGALLLEPSRSNSITYSEDFTQSSWTRPNINVTPNVTTAPNGTTTADLIIEEANGGSLRQAISVSGQLTFSFYLKYASGTNTSASLFCTDSNQQAGFNLQTGVVNYVSNSTATIENAGNGWYRCTMSFNSSASSTLILFPNYESEIGGVYAWGAQLEQGSYATSYIPTQGSIGTRVAESCSQTPPSGIIGQTEGVLFIDFTPNTDTISTKWLSFLGGGSQYIGIYVVNTSNVIRLEVSNTTAQAAFNSSFPITKGTRYKCAIAYANNDFTAYINGVQLGTVTNGSVPTTSTLQSYYNLSSIESINTNDLRLYNTRLSNTELAALTS